eukprot:TRINITY_DN395_c0_g1_i4.p1 TRINITY_DN395_c0_g1~~TRINITY_DN395_c0_g1_i4.p1  ORF type:complete len:201 (+),score=0.34 TRINITY_DN395_c0_g1_i4:70-603(+)
MEKHAIAKPNKVIDNSYTPFIPFTKHQITSGDAKVSPKPTINIKDAKKHFDKCPHPYEKELNELSFPDSWFSTSVKKPKDLTKTPFTFIDSVESLKALAATLEKEKEIAVDLEHHSWESYQGFTCLIQISTRSEDFILDPFTVWEHLSILSKVSPNNKPFSGLYKSRYNQSFPWCFK